MIINSYNYKLLFIIFKDCHYKLYTESVRSIRDKIQFASSIVPPHRTPFSILIVADQGWFSSSPTPH